MDGIIEQDCLEILKKIDLSPMKNKTVCVTGANGLIGTYLIYVFHLANVHKDAGIRIIAISRNPPCEKLKDIFKDSHEFYSLDLSKPDASEFPFTTDYIIHGATYAQPGKFLQNYLETIHLNTTATEKLLKKAGSDGARMLFLSSSEVYGNPDEDNIPTPETYPGLCSPVSIRSVYSESKCMGETLCFTYRNFESVDVKIARISMTYGPGVSVHDKRVMAQFIKQALAAGKIRMLDDGSKVRTFCYISDCILMLLNILLYGKDFVYNVGGKDRVTIRELADEICLLTGSSLETEPAANSRSASPPDGNSKDRSPDHDIRISPNHVELDIGKVLREFNLPPFMPFREGLARTIRWNRQFYP